jgi:hypothetical protein
MLLFSASFYSENTIFFYFFAYTTKNQKHHYRIIFILLHYYLPYNIAYYILFYLHLDLVLDNHSVELGTQDKEIVLQVAWRRMIGAFSTVPREFNIKPWVPSWGKFTLTTTLCIRSPEELAHLLSVIKTIFWHRYWGTKESIHSC